jgi:hypothetical protein
VIGIALTGLSIVVMPWLARVKRQAGEQMHSRLVIADAAETKLCAWLSVSTFAGLLGYALVGWTWIDPVAGFVIAAFAIWPGGLGRRTGQQRRRPLTCQPPAWWARSPPPTAAATRLTPAPPTPDPLCGRGPWPKTGPGGRLRGRREWLLGPGRRRRDQGQDHDERRGIPWWAGERNP